uniref:Neurotransmitter-gated ion-channel ligand-binding domain-containing protein n=1 Tax=Strigamia maritima TaxID=126957 RepID=T1JBH5_STRMM
FTCEEAKLNDLLFNQRKISNISRPVQEINDTLDLEVWLAIFNVLYLDEQTETFSFQGWQVDMWRDLNLIWNPEEFNNCNYFIIQEKDIWKPNLLVLNGADASNLAPNISSDTVISILATGDVFWYQINTYNVICPLDFSAYPFDEHLCQITFISWEHTGNELNISVGANNTHFHTYMMDEHNQWELISSFSNVSDFFYGEDLFYQEVNFFVRLKRRSLYYHLALITPNAICILIILLTFWVPHESNGKLLVSGVNVIILTVLLIHFHWVVPRNGSNVPTIIIFCGNSIFFAGLAFIISVATTCTYKEPPVIYPPTWIKNLLTSWLGTILGINFQKMEISTNNATEKSPHAAAWKTIAIAIDRLFFLLYCIIFTCILIFTFV